MDHLWCQLVLLLYIIINTPCWSFWVENILWSLDIASGAHHFPVYLGRSGAEIVIGEAPASRMWCELLSEAPNRLVLGTHRQW